MEMVNDNMLRGVDSVSVTRRDGAGFTPSSPTSVPRAVGREVVRAVAVLEQ